MSKPRAFSYIRFSRPEQMRGDSLRRQVDAANKWAAEKGSKPLVVDGPTALTWLKGRRGYVPTPATARDDAFLADRIAKAATVADLAGIIREADVGGDYLDRVGKTSWDDVAAVIASLDVGSIQNFGGKLGVDVPAFVGRAVELALRERLALLTR